MKNHISLLLAFACITGTANSQGISVPEAVKSAFAAKFPDATNVKWGKENATEFEAEFKSGTTAVSANFKKDGSWVETETTISPIALPAAVTAAILKKYPGSTVTRAEQLEQPGKSRFEVLIKNKGKNKEAEILPDGTFVN